jgi:hypothetical protein
VIVEYIWGQSVEDDSSLEGHNL